MCGREDLFLVAGEVEPEFEMRVEREDGHAILRRQRGDHLVGVKEEVHLPADPLGVAGEVGLDEVDEEAAFWWSAAAFGGAFCGLRRRGRRRSTEIVLDP